MGFMSEEVIVVGSSVFNLAGDADQRGVYLKNTILNSTLSGSSQKTGIGMDIFNSHMQGPGTKIHNYAKWARTSGYAEKVGGIEGVIVRNNTISEDAFNALFPSVPNKEYDFISSYLLSINYKLLAEQYLGDHYPTRLAETYSVTADTVEVPALIGTRQELTGKLKIKFAADNLVFTPPVDIFSNASITYVRYRERTLLPPIVTTDPLVTTENSSDLPNLSGFSGSYSAPVTHTETLTDSVRTVVTYSDSTPGSDTTVNTPKSASIDTKEGTFSKLISLPITVTGGIDRTISYSIWFTYRIAEMTVTNSVTEGTKTTTTTTTTQSLVQVYKYQHTQSDLTVGNWSLNKILTYVKGTDPIIDALIYSGLEQTMGMFIPIIPLRLHNTAVDKENYPEQYEWNRKASRKAFGKKKEYDKLLTNLKENPDVKSIDHAWIVYGVSLGSTQRDGKLYLYEFFKTISNASTEEHTLTASSYAAAVVEYWDALEDYEKGSENGPRGDPPVPPKVTEHVFKTYTTTPFGGQIAATPWEYNISISAKGGYRYSGTGFNSRADNKKNVAWVYVAGQVSVKNRREVSQGDGSYWEYFYETSDVIRIGKQITEDFWEEYEYFDLVHTNVVYEGVSVITLGGAAITTGENSSFLIPLNEAMFNNMNLIRRTQLSLECAFLTINYYDKQEIPWYASGLFQIIIVVIIIVVAIYTGYVDGNTVGLLGTNAAVGAAIGLTSTAAIVAGAILNALAAAIVSALITKLSTALLGDKIGTIVGAVVSMVVLWGATSTKGFDMSSMLQSMTKADNLLKLTMTGAKMVGDYMSMTAQEIVADTKNLMAEFKESSDEISKMAEEYLGSTGLDPMLISEATRFMQESSEEFLTRTLMTGDDIVNTTIDLVETFPQQQLKLPYLKG